MTYAEELQERHEAQLREDAKKLTEIQIARTLCDLSEQIITTCESLKNAPGTYSHTLTWIAEYIIVMTAYNDSHALGFDAELARSKIDIYNIRVGLEQVQKIIALQSIITDTTSIYESSLKTIRGKK